MNIHVFIVNYFSEDDTLDLVDQIVRLTANSNINITICVYDNGSSDNRLKTEPAIDVFIEGNNIGLAAGWVELIQKTDLYPKDTLIFLNNDVILDSDFFHKLVESRRFLDTSIITPAIYDLGGHCWSAGGKFKYCGILVDHSNTVLSPTPYLTDHISGCCIIASVENYDLIGGFDPLFFFRGEEWDFNFRAKMKNVNRMVVPDLVITHKVNGSHDPSSPKGVNQALIAKKIYWEKHFRLISIFLLSILCIKLVIKTLINYKSFKYFSVIFKGVFSK
ncbi:hypothetical protein OAA71_02170 [Porticoccaceae bacterium]|nr:hypothetical protein [Porticoccaceae bacterium]